MVKVLYLLVGLTLKQTIDEFKSINSEAIACLTKAHDSLGEYRGPSAAQKSSPEAFRLIAQARHAQDVAPQQAKIRKRIRFRRYLPVWIYGALTLVLLGLIAFLESRGVE